MQIGARIYKQASAGSESSDGGLERLIAGVFSADSETAGSKQPSQVPKDLQDELVWMYARRTQASTWGIPLVAAPMAIPLFGPAPTWMVVGWLGLITAALGIRWVVRRRVPKRTGVAYANPSSKWFGIGTLISGMLGGTLALVIAFFPYLTESERLFESMCLVAFWFGSVSVTSGYHPAFLAFTLPMFVPVTAWWVFHSGGPKDGWFHYLVAATLVLFGVRAVLLSRDSFRRFRESFAARLREVELNHQLGVALEQAETASRAKTRFLASASHDLRQPIHTVSLFGAALSMRPLDAPTREIAQHLNTATQVLASQLDALLDISKLDAKVVRVEAAQIKLHDFLERLCQEFEPDARTKGLALTFDCPSGGFIETDPLLFERVIRNLLDNAIKYTDNGHIKVNVARTDGDFTITVEDTGRGIPDSEQGRVFEEFYQLDNPERDRTRGLGLGLPIVRRLTELLKLRLDMESSPGKGTKLSLRLAAAEPKPRAIGHAAPMSKAPSDLHVLVVDDEAEVRLGMKSLLEGMDCRVTLADGTAGAVDIARRNKPDVVLSDLRLRGTDNGIKTVQAIRALYPEMPAILISGDIAPERLREAEAAGIPLLHKPVPLDVLKHAIVKAAG